MSDVNDQAAVERAASQEALRCRLSVLRNMDKPDRARKISLGLMGLHGWEANRDQVANADLITTQLVTSLVAADIFVAPPDLCALLNAPADERAPGGAGHTVALSYPGEVMKARDIIVPNGMIYFADAIQDPTGDALPIRAISWTVAQGDDPAIRYLEPDPDQMILTLIGYADTRLLYPADQLQDYPRILPVLPVVWQVGVQGGGAYWEGDTPGEREAQEAADKRRLPYIKTLMAWWSIMRQRLTESDEVIVRKHPKELTRALRRRPDLNTGMHLIRMRPRRRYQYTDYSGGGKPDWSHSWWVRSYWREDWRARQRGEEEYQLVASHEKGPWDKPVRHVERVWLPPKPPKNQR